MKCMIYTKCFILFIFTSLDCLKANNCGQRVPDIFAFRSWSWWLSCFASYPFSQSISNPTSFRSLPPCFLASCLFSDVCLCSSVAMSCPCGCTLGFPPKPFFVFFCGITFASGTRGSLTGLGKPDSRSHDQYFWTSKKRKSHNVTS